MLDSDVSCYDYYNSLAPDIREKLIKEDVRSFEEMQSCVNEIKNNKK